MQDGYVETTRAFATEVHEERTALNINDEDIGKGLDVKEDENAGHRQRNYSFNVCRKLLTLIPGIRAAILEGDIDKAIKHTNAYYPTVLKDHENIYFQLRCRKFIEMVRQGAEIQAGISPGPVKNGTSNGRNSIP